MLYLLFVFKCDMTFKITIRSKFNRDSFEMATIIFVKKLINSFVLYISIFNLLLFL
jgi:hypothetical protein